MSVPVFFYGLFMDEQLLRDAGGHPINPRRATVSGWALRIAARATLVRQPDSVVHGIVMDLTHDELDRLYAVESLRAYRPDPVLCESRSDRFAALSYNLTTPPAAADRNEDYAQKLRQVAMRLQLPADYIDAI